MDSSELETPKPYDGFHTYAVEVVPGSIDFFFDNTKYHTVFTDRQAGKAKTIRSASRTASCRLHPGRRVGRRVSMILFFRGNS